jgi:hypothetical protein
MRPEPFYWGQAPTSEPLHRALSGLGAEPILWPSPCRLIVKPGIDEFYG